MGDLTVVPRRSGGAGASRTILEAGARPYQSGLARLGTCQPALPVRALGSTPKLWSWATYSGWVCCAAQVCAGNDTATGVGDDNARGA